MDAARAVYPAVLKWVPSPESNSGWIVSPSSDMTDAKSSVPRICGRDTSQSVQAARFASFSVPHPFLGGTCDRVCDGPDVLLDQRKQRLEVILDLGERAGGVNVVRSERPHNGVRPSERREPFPLLAMPQEPRHVIPGMRDDHRQRAHGSRILRHPRVIHGKSRPTPAVRESPTPAITGVDTGVSASIHTSKGVRSEATTAAPGTAASAAATVCHDPPIRLYGAAVASPE